MKYLFCFCLLLISCATPKATQNSPGIDSFTDYPEMIERYSDHRRSYSGLYNTLDVEGTLLTPSVLSAQLQAQKDTFQWDDKKLNEEKIKSESRLNREAELFLSFFTPERKNDDLSKPKTMWKIFLDVDGRRYEGRFTKVKLQLAEIQGLYPYHNRFYSPYSVTFPVPMQNLVGKSMSVTLTGPVASTTLEFKP